MSERQYFSLRYAIPGYTFILLVIGTNYVPSLKILTTLGFESAFGAFLAFLSLLSGSAIGFLISQFWWWRFQRNVGIFGVKQFKEAIRVLCDKYEIAKPKNVGEKRRLLAVYDYVSHSEKREKVFILAQRRWDVYHVLKSTFHTLWIGFSVGILCRFLYQSFLSEPLHTIAFEDLIPILSKNVEPMVLVFIFVIVAFWLHFLRKGAEWMITEYAYVSAARIRSSKVKPKDLKKAFPDIFLKSAPIHTKKKEG